MIVRNSADFSGFYRVFNRTIDLQDELASVGIAPDMGDGMLKRILMGMHHG
jgi:hypothetical protein